jgi:hypothetical protein
MSDYRYVATNILSGALLADSLPLHVSSFARNFGGVGQPGQLTGYLDLGTIGGGSQSAYLGALEPRKTMLWALQDNWPIYAGIVWDWPHQSAASNQLPLNVLELGSLFATKREVRSNIVFPVATDVFTVVRALLTYSLSKPNGGVAQLQLGTNLAGITVPAGFTVTGANSQKIGDAINALAAQYNFEYGYAPGLDVNGNLIITLQLGYPFITRTVANTNLQFLYPGNALDYAWPRNGSASINDLRVTANSAGSIPWQSNASGGGHGQNTADLALGYPLLEGSTSYTTAPITTQAQIDAVADGQVPKLGGTATIPQVTVAGGTVPKAGQIQLGDEANFAATSTLHPANADNSPGIQTKVRVIGWKVTPPDDGQPESTDYFLGGIVT